MPRISHTNKVAVVIAIKALHEDACSLDMLQKVSGLGRELVRKYVKLFHRDRLVRIAEWHKVGNNRNWTPYYEWNPNKLRDVPKPPRKSKTQINADYEAKRRSIINQVVHVGL